ncbi:MAG: AMP-binding protein [Bacteroidetes bacterium]|nr:AMP-binding protein [Bacteroidota bacterium]
MPEKGIEWKGTFYTWNTIRNTRFPGSVLEFCHEWLQNQESFSMKTSGSTGTPKTIELKRQHMAASAELTKELLQPETTDSLFLGINSDTIGGRMILVRAMEWDLAIKVVEAQSNPLNDLNDNHPYTITSLVPYQLSEILKDKNSLKKLSLFEKILIGGAPLDPILEEKLQGLNPLFFLTYGMTETCSHVAARQLNGKQPQKFFHPLQGVRVGINEREALWIETPTSDSHPVQTNDRARILANGSFEILGRLDRTINSGGVKIQLEELEALIAPHLQGIPFYCDATEDSRLGQKLVLILESEPFETKELLLRLKSELPPYKAPKAIIFAPNFEWTQSGKIDRIKTSLQWAKTN